MASDPKTGPKEPPAASAWSGARGLGVFAGIAAVGAVADLASKSYAFAHIPGDGVEVVPGLFNLIQAWNKGAAFSIFFGQVNAFIAISFVALVVLGWFAWSAKRPAGLGYQVILGLVGAGVVGNLYDRLVFHQVRDFLDVYVSQAWLADWLARHAGTTHWPTFNVADAFICVGTGALFVKFWRDESRTQRHVDIHEQNKPHLA
jgi:signal peptidase II